MPSLASVQSSPILLMTREHVAHPERRVARGDLIRVRPGVFADAADWDALPRWDRHLARVHAVSLRHPDAVFCLESAAALQGIPTLGDPGVVHVLLPPRAPSRLIGGIRTHNGAGDRTIIEVGGLLMTCPADTAVDLARHRHGAIGLAAADAVLRADPDLDAADLCTRNERRHSKRGRRIARWALTRGAPEAETAFESVSRAVIEWSGFPAPTLQQVFDNGGAVDRTDFWWPADRLAGEADGDLKYDGRFGTPTEMLRERRARDARLRARARAVAHWGWSDLTGPDTPLRGILLGFGLRPIAPADTAQLVTLRRALASPPRETTSPGRNHG